MSKQPVDSWIGHVLRKDYRIDTPLGEGGQATLYRGTDLQMELPIAIKHFKKTSKGVQNDPERFIREARNQAKLSHQNIVAIRAVFDEDDELFIVMEYVDGPTLEDLLASSEQKPRLPLDQIGHIFLQVLRGLGYAHKSNIIHRDIKPSNILLTKDHKVKLADFGLARAAQDKRLTQAGLVIGTPAYLAPEQLEGSGDIDPRSDIYSVGVTLYEILCGNTPFQQPGEGEVPPFELLGRHLFMTPPSLREVGADTPEELEDIVMKSIAKDPNERYSSCKEFSTALRSIFTDPSDTMDAPIQDTVFEISIASLQQSAEHAVYSEAFDQSAEQAEFSSAKDYPSTPGHDLIDAIHKTPSQEDLESLGLDSDPPENLRKTEEMSVPPEFRTQINPSEENAPRNNLSQSSNFIKYFTILLIIALTAGAFWLRGKKIPPPHNRTTPRNLRTLSKPYPQKVPGVPMVKVKVGLFYMGKGRKKTKNSYTPQIDIYLSTFWIDQFEVTNRQYRQCIQSKGCDTPSRSSIFDNDKLNHPVTHVTWSNAAQYCRWAEKDLPTEAQWEKASRGIKAASYPWGNLPKECLKANYKGCNRGTKSVGPQERPEGKSPYGAYDMSGNVWEWVRDCYDRDAYLVLSGHNPVLKSDNPIFEKNPHKSAWLKKKTEPWRCLQRVLRGGSWKSPHWGLFSFARRGAIHRLKSKDVGFRCVWNPPSPR